MALLDSNGVEIALDAEVNTATGHGRVVAYLERFFGDVRVVVDVGGEQQVLAPCEVTVALMRTPSTVEASPADVHSDVIPFTPPVANEVN